MMSCWSSAIRILMGVVSGMLLFDGLSPFPGSRDRRTPYDYLSRGCDSPSRRCDPAARRRNENVVFPPAAAWYALCSCNLPRMYSSMAAIRPQTAARVLVADDQPDVLEALRWLLTGEGYEPEFVSSTDAVLDRLRERPFDLLLMDLNYSRDTTSGREGLELIPRVRAHDPSMPIVVMTWWGSVDTAVEAMRRGAKSFVQKPWEDHALREIVGREIDDGRAARRQDRKQHREQEEARLIQRALLPSTMPPTDGVAVAASWQPADGVGGDCFDVMASGPLTGIVIADVAG